MKNCKQTKTIEEQGKKVGGSFKRFNRRTRIN